MEWNNFKSCICFFIHAKIKQLRYLAAYVFFTHKANDALLESTVSARHVYSPLSDWLYVWAYLLTLGWSRYQCSCCRLDLTSTMSSSVNWLNWEKKRLSIRHIITQLKEVVLSKWAGTAAGWNNLQKVLWRKCLNIQQLNKPNPAHSKHTVQNAVKVVIALPDFISPPIRPDLLPTLTITSPTSCFKMVK